MFVFPPDIRKCYAHTFSLTNEETYFLFICESKAFSHSSVLTLKLLALKCQRQIRICKTGYFLQSESSLMEISLLLKILF